MTGETRRESRVMASNTNNGNNKVFVTGIWDEESAGGVRYFSGHLSPTCKVLIFKNGFKQKKADPDWKMYFVYDEPKPQASPEVESDFDDGRYF
jgi:hypothetical protein